MRRVLLALPVVVAATALAAGCGGSSRQWLRRRHHDRCRNDRDGGGAAVGKTLSGSVGPGFDISMKEKTVAPGTYTLNVDDQGTIHNFHFTGPGGVDVKTDVSGTGKQVIHGDAAERHVHLRLRPALEPDARHVDGELIERIHSWAPS